jgi:hypothetical protein
MILVDLFQEKSDIASNFDIQESQLDGVEILFAEYHYECYSGSATVIFEKDGKLFEVNGNHCSCYGLEGQWEPEETTWAALAMWNYDSEPYAEEWKKLIAEHVK